jgi:hypothetical protein
VDGRPTTFELNGLRGSNFVMRDQLTGSDWQQGTGESFAGPQKGKRLELVPFRIATWGEWRAQYPTSLAFVVKPDMVEQYQLMAGRQRDLMAFPRPARDPLREDGRLGATVMVAGVEAGGGEKAFALAALKAAPVLNDRVGTLPIVLLYNTDTETHRAYSRRVGGQELNFEAGKGSTDLVDRESGSRWNEYGACIEGKLKGAHLDEVLLQPTFWFAWAQFHPRTEVVPFGIN